MARTEVVGVRLTPAQLARLEKLPKHPADRSVADLLRRVLEAGCAELERQQGGTDGTL